MADRLTFRDVGDGKKFNIARINDAGDIVSEMEITDKEYRIKSAAKVLGLKWDELMRLFGSYKRGGPSEIPLGAEPEKPQSTTFLLRGINQPAEQGQVYDDIFAALVAPCSEPDPVIEWDSTDQWCILDLDFHDGDIPNERDLSRVADTLWPVPRAWWPSRSKGLHCLYPCGSACTAGEFGACAAVRLAVRFPAASIELKHSTRRPPGEVVRREGVQTDPAIGNHSSNQSDYSDWLEEHEYRPGERYPHTQCPVAPSPRAMGNMPPVVVHHDHIRCYICEADGIRRGSRYAGYFPLSVLSGCVQTSLFARCVENFTHWDHARHVVLQIIRNEPIAEIYYRACLKMKHGAEDPRIPLVFTAAPKTGLLRYDGYWVGASGRVKTYGRESAVLASLPVCKYIDRSKPDEPKLKVNAAVLEEISSGDDLTAYGYPALVCVWGCRLTHMQDAPEGRMFTILQRNGEPQYLGRSARYPEEDSWQILEGLYPGLNRKAVELLVVAKGCTEMRSGLPPVVFLTGPTGAGKTQSIHLAASICGDTATVISYTHEEERLRQSILTAKERGSYAFFDEYLKRARARHIDPDRALEFLLNLESGSVSHKLYVGPVPLGNLPVCCFADTAMPREVEQHAQLSRRMHHIPLKDSKRWSHAAKDLRRNEDYIVKAADSILSYVIDRWFGPGEATDFAYVARQLGFGGMDSSEANRNKDRIVRDFYALVCAMPDADARTLKTAGIDEPGWKLIDPHGAGDVTDLWSSLADDSGSRILTESDLRNVLGTTERVECHIRNVKRGVLINFKKETA